MGSVVKIRTWATSAIRKIKKLIFQMMQSNFSSSSETE